MKSTSAPSSTATATAWAISAASPQKLDYLQDLGVTAIWLLPFYPSPWRDDGYDISDYTDVHPAYGTLRDFQAFLREAHRARLARHHRAGAEPHLRPASLVSARRAAPRPARAGAISTSGAIRPERYRDARIIFKDFETSNWTWDPVAKAYYWHRFYSHQPDLNFDNPEVRNAMFKAIDFWFDLGVDGFRLDAVPYLYEREGTNCENLPETHAFLKELAQHVDAQVSATACCWPRPTSGRRTPSPISAAGDECHMAFHFPLMPRLFMAMRMEDRYPDHRHPAADAADSRKPASGRCSCAITTS